MYRNYEEFGYITDNRNFGYKRSDDNSNDIGDKILSESGSIFFSVLDDKPQDINMLTSKICTKFSDIDFDIIKNDALEFYSRLEMDGFVVSGDTVKKCQKKDIKFSYKDTQDLKFSNLIPKDENSTQDFILQYFNEEPQLTSLHIEILSECNERCLHCYIPHENKFSKIKPELFYNILDQCRDMNLLHITISGGEPMMHEEFCNFLAKCREYNLSVNVLSNLTLLNEQILNEMKANQLLGVQVSLYSMNPNVHDEITQSKGSFEKTKNAILKLIDNDIPLKISCPILKQNKDTYLDVVNWGKTHKIHVGNDYVILARYNHTTQNLNHRLSLRDVKDVIYNIANYDNEYIKELKTESDKKQKLSANDFICSICSSSFCISDNGNVHPCAGWLDCVVGNVNNSTLKEIWNNSEKVNYLRNLKRKDFPKCLKCSDKDFCTMCMVRNANEDPHGNPLVVNEFFCNIAKINREIFEKYEKKNYSYSDV